MLDCSDIIRMRIAIFSDNFYPELSGITDSVTLLGSALAERGHQVCFVAPRYAEKDYRKAGLPFGEKDMGPNISVIRLPSVIYLNSPTGQSRIAIPLGPLGPVISKLKKFNPDVIHTQSPFGAGLEALVSARILKVPLVGTNHTPIAEFMAYSPFHPKWFVEMTVRYYSWYYNHCSFVSAPCNALLDDMAKHGFKKSPGNGDDRPAERRAVSNPVHLDAFSPIRDEREKTDLKRRFGFSPHTVLYTGRLAKEKCVDVIVRAIALVQKEIPDITFAVTGHGPAKTSLEKIARALGLKDRVKFLGYVDSAEFPLVYRASDIFAIMSTAETQCLSLMQAFASGLPGIGARAWGLPEYIDHEDGFILEPGDEKGLAHIITELFKSPERMRELGAHGMAAVKKYSPQAVALEWETLYAHTAAAEKSKREKAKNGK